MESLDGEEPVTKKQKTQLELEPKLDLAKVEKDMIIEYNNGIGLGDVPGSNCHDLCLERMEQNTFSELETRNLMLDEEMCWGSDKYQVLPSFCGKMKKDSRGVISVLEKKSDGMRSYFLMIPCFARCPCKFNANQLKEGEEKEVCDVSLKEIMDDLRETYYYCLATFPESNKAIAFDYQHYVNHMDQKEKDANLTKYDNYLVKQIENYSQIFDFRNSDMVDQKIHLKIKKRKLEIEVEIHANTTKQLKMVERIQEMQNNQNIIPIKNVAARNKFQEMLAEHLSQSRNVNYMLSYTKTTYHGKDHRVS